MKIYTAFSRDVYGILVFFLFLFFLSLSLFFFFLLKGGFKIVVWASFAKNAIVKYWQCDIAFSNEKAGLLSIRRLENRRTQKQRWNFHLQF